MDLNVDGEKFDELANEIEREWDTMLADPDSFLNKMLAVDLSLPEE